MEYNSYKFLLASSCLALALAAPLPLLGMEPEENERVSIPVAAPTPVQEENWKDSLYAFPEIQAGFKMDVFNRLLFTPEFKDPTKQNALFQCLEQAAFERMNPKALEKVKQFSTKPFLHINRVDPDKVKKAENLLVAFSVSEKNAEFKVGSHSEYLYQRGGVYQEGLGVKKDPDLAKQFFFRTLELDANPNTLLSLGLLYHDAAPSMPQNRTITRLLWERAEAGGNAIASSNLAMFYWEIQNFPKAIEYFKKVSEKGDLLSTLNLATIYEKGEKGVEKDYKQALKYFLRAFNSKEIDTKEKNKCAGHIGVMYSKGFPGMLPDYKKALHFFMQADIYDPKIQCNIAFCYKKLKEHKNAFKWLNKAATQNDPRALYEVAHLSYRGLGTKRNIAKARDYFKRAAKLGGNEDFVPEALYNYAALMKDIDSNTTHVYMLQAAERGYSLAMIALAGYYLYMSTQNPNALGKAFFWIKKAQELNDPQAQTLFDAATKKAQEGEEGSKDDVKLVECMETLDQPQVVDSPASVSSSPSASPQETSPSSDSSEEETIVADNYTITSQEVEQWQVEQRKWKEDIKNPKFVREKLREAHQDFRDKREVQERPPLSSASAKTIDTLRNKGSRSEITIDNLFSLFEDPYFQGQVDMFKTSDGYAIVGYNFSTGAAKNTGTHRKHNKSYKGLDRNFLESVAELVKEFMISSSVQG